METIAKKYNSLSPEKKQRVSHLLQRLKAIEAGESLLNFTEFTFQKFQKKWFHEVYYETLDKFIKKEIKNLIISMPPQVGKSEGSSRRLPAFITGYRPDDKMALISYSASKAQKFGREIISIMNEPEFKAVFPHVKYPDRGHREAKANTNMERESLNSVGSMRFVGVEGPLTGETVDVLIYDDLYKDWQDANSPVIQERVWDWYLTVANTRLHNDSQQLMVFTRWSENDLTGKLQSMGKVIPFNGGNYDIPDDCYLHINFQALKEGKPTKLDLREHGEALWPEKHSREKLKAARAKDPDKFDCLYQGTPVNKEGLLYSSPFKTCRELPEFKIRKAYVDTADTGTDYLCAIVYGLPFGTDKGKYVIDILYTDKGMEVTEPQTADLLNQNNVNQAKVESNNGGRSFARNVERLLTDTKISWFHQSKNKEARIFSNSATVNDEIIFPENWHVQWPEFYKAVTKFKKVFKANKHDDAPDVLTGIIETENEKPLTLSPNADLDDLGLF